jgi:hypothetical protein
MEHVVPFKTVPGRLPARDDYGLEGRGNAWICPISSGARFQPMQIGNSNKHILTRAVMVRNKTQQLLKMME